MSEKSQSKKAGSEAPGERERRLAEALRANLKRRKAAKRPEKDADAP